jgi:hypothetical protein
MAAIVAANRKDIFVICIYFTAKLQNNMQGKSLNTDLPCIFTELPVPITYFTLYSFATAPLPLQ